MTEREQMESAIREAFQIGKASANEHIAFSSTAIALEALIQRTAKQARATPALPQVPEGMAIVPVDAITPEMWSAGRNEFCRIYDRVRYAMHSEIESAEIDAAPQSMMTAMLAAAKERQS